MPSQTPDVDPRELLGRREGAAFIQRSEATLDRLTASGALPCYRYGGRTMFDPADLRAYVAASRVEGPRG